MADKLMQPTWDPLVLAAQLQKIAKQSQTLMQRFLSNQPAAIKLGFGDTSSLGFDFFELMTKMMINPAVVASAQIDLCNDTLRVWQNAAQRMLMLRAHEADAPKDKRFKHPEWSENAIFSFVKESYLVAAKSILSAVREIKGMDDATARKGGFLHAPIRRCIVAFQFRRNKSGGPHRNPRVWRAEPATWFGESSRRSGTRQWSAFDYDD